MLLVATDSKCKLVNVLINVTYALQWDKYAQTPCLERLIIGYMVGS